VPAAAVIPAPIAYIKVVAVKKLVVGFLVWGGVPCSSLSTFCYAVFPTHQASGVGGAGNRVLSFFRSFTVSKSECSKQA